MKKYKVGLVVGKFCPLHRGHQMVIDKAFEECQFVTILSWTSVDYGFPAELRQRWLKKLYPKAHVLVIQPDRCPKDDAQDLVQRMFCANLLEEIYVHPDAVYTSELYGDGFAQHLTSHLGEQVNHVMVDLHRDTHHVSGTRLRAYPQLLEEFCDPYVSANLEEHTKRILLIGAESSGKSTLTELLGLRLQSPTIGEYGRTLWDEKNGELERSDYLHIAQTQIRLENIDHCDNAFIFCDTSPLVTEFYANQFSISSRELHELSFRRYHMTFFLQNDFPYVEDGTRNGLAFGEEQREYYKKRLPAGWVPVSGVIGNRIRTVVNSL
jgi:NadR type nicotinamide-nucleotide adenylyltransferase